MGAKIPSTGASGQSTPRWGRDARLNAISAFVFSISVSMVAAVQPLFGLKLGLDPRTVGLFISVSAICQISMRFALRWLLRAFSARTLVLVADALLALACLSLLAQASLVAFFLSQALQGTSRAIFYTASQAQVVRRPDLVRELSLVVFAAALGSFIAPLIAGGLASISFAIAFSIAAMTALLAMVPGILMARGEPFAGRRSDVRGFRKDPAVRLACESAAVAGTWKGLMDSYVPVGLSQAGLGPGMVGVVLTFGTGLSIVGSAVAGFAKRRIQLLARLSILGVGFGLVLAASFSRSTIVGLIGLAIAGGGAGILQSIAPALGSREVDPEQRGEVVALTGLWRALALFGSPFSVSLLLLWLPLSGAVAVVGLSCSGPAVVERGVRRARSR